MHETISAWPGSGNCEVRELSKGKTLWVLFKSLFLLSCCAFGGGYVVISLMKRKFVEDLGWLSEEEMLDITAITQSCPGPLLVNASVAIGFRMAGALGVAVAIVAAVLPPMVIIGVISLFYTQFRTNPYIATALQVMRAGVAAVIVDVVWNLAKNICLGRRILYISMMAVGFLATVVFAVSGMLVIFACLAIGITDLVIALIKEKRRVG